MNNEDFYCALRTTRRYKYATTLLTHYNTTHNDGRKLGKTKNKEMRVERPKGLFWKHKSHYPPSLLLEITLKNASETSVSASSSQQIFIHIERFVRRYLFTFTI